MAADVQPSPRGPALGQATDDVGRDSSLAFDASGTPWVTHDDDTNDDLAVAEPRSAADAAVVCGTLRLPGPQRQSRDAHHRLDFGKRPRGEANCTATANLEGYCGVLADDGDRDGVASVAGEAPVYVFAQRYDAATSRPSGTWVGRSTVAPSSAITMQVYRFGTTNAWETPTPGTNTCSTAGANADCTIRVTGSGPTAEYFETDGSKYWAYFRVVQVAGAETLI